VDFSFTSFTRKTTSHACFVAGLFCAGVVSSAQVGAIYPAGTPQSWVQAAADSELPVINADGQNPLRYRMHKVDAKGDTTRMQIESKQGDVARLIERNGHALAREDNEAEIERLKAILASPDDFLRHHKHDNATRADVTQLVRLIPQAMIFSYTPGQPQRVGMKAAQVVIDVRSDPAFKPPTMLSDALTGIEGRLWIDAASHHLLRIEGRFLKQVNFGYGLVARIFPGGTIEFEQADAGNGRWVYSSLVEDLTVRAMLVKTIPQKSLMTASDFQRLPAPIDFQQAVRELIAMPVHTQ
jgi:hypothetical protein